MSASADVDNEFEESAMLVCDKGLLRPELKDEEVVRREETEFEVSKTFIAVTESQYSDPAYDLAPAHIGSKVGGAVLDHFRNEFGEKKKLIMARPKNGTTPCIKVKVKSKYTVSKGTYVMQRGNNGRVGLANLVMRNEKKVMKRM